VGLLTFTSDLNPHYPREFMPQLKQTPKSVTSTVCAAPQHTAIILWFISDLSSTGFQMIYYSYSTPHYPYALSPHVYPNHYPVTAIPFSTPQDTSRMSTPTNSSIYVGLIIYPSTPQQFFSFFPQISTLGLPLKSFFCCISLSNLSI